MCAQFQAVVEPDQEVLAERLDRGDLAPDDALDLREGARAARSRRRDRAAHEVRPESRRSPEEGVAFGHSDLGRERRDACRSSSQQQPGIPGDQHRLLKVHLEDGSELDRIAGT